MDPVTLTNEYLAYTDSVFQRQIRRQLPRPVNLLHVPFEIPQHYQDVKVGLFILLTSSIRSLEVDPFKAVAVDHRQSGF